jgi:hypothetical protein
VARNRSFWIKIANPICGASCVEFLLCGRDGQKTRDSIWQDDVRGGGCNLRRARRFFFSVAEVADAVGGNSESAVAPSLQLAQSPDGSINKQVL